ncbi:histidinol dehydrogenase [Francisellaceae bacterium]|nr:histidinol dehydrogenase [Francisellaceae bacterium]
MKILRWNLLLDVEQEEVLKRPMLSNQQQLRVDVSEILQEVKQKGDQALYGYTEKLEGASLSRLMVSDAEFLNAEKSISQEKLQLLKSVIARIRNYHQAFLPSEQLVDTQDGVQCRRLYRPIQRVGLYVPGGSAPLISTLMMLGVPAQLAKCPVSVICTPVNQEGKIHPLLLVAAKLCGIGQVYKLGGAQAIAAMAYGTESIPKVDKIYGPGNSWVTEAKIQVSEDAMGAAIDMPAGPSEVMVIADKMANPIFVAADLLAQAEHGPDSQVILITESKILAEQVILELENQKVKLSRQSILQQSLQYARIIVVDDIKTAIDINNDYAPEHLILQIEKAETYLPLIQRGSAVFMGAWTPEALGDYVTGSNHVLPTYGHARSFSGLSVTDFMVAISVQEANKQGIQAIGGLAVALAEIEGLDAHKEAVKVRLDALNVGGHV